MRPLGVAASGMTCPGTSMVLTEGYHVTGSVLWSLDVLSVFQASASQCHFVPFFRVLLTWGPGMALTP